jgi:class 3 adenylate cyclase/predicted ATPase
MHKALSFTYEVLMDFSKTAYLASDRLKAVLSGSDLPQSTTGSVLFADISGFTPLTERLRERLGNRRGVEALAVLINRVYDALVAEVDRYGGAIIDFAGDAITCWFSGEVATLRATACGFALLTAMRTVERIELPDIEPISLGLKVAIATGTTRRFLIGDPDIQRIDALAGAVVARVAAGEELAERGEFLADIATVERLGNVIEIREWRQHEQERFAVLERLTTQIQPLPVPSGQVTPLDESLLFPLLPLFTRGLPTGIDAFQIELRPVTALFLRFTGIDYDQDADAGEKLDRLMRLVQQIVTRYEGNVLQLTIGDKGSYLYASFGAPYAHEDDPARALSAALDIRDRTATLTFLDPVQIGISQGIMRTGAYGGTTRRTYGALGDEVNLAARLMQRAKQGTILISESMLASKIDRFVLQRLAPMQVKGKANTIRVFQVIGQRDRSFEERFYTTPLVGRDDVLTQIEAAFGLLLEKRNAGISTIHGDAGIGKSRLIFEAQQRLQAQATVTWLIGQADPLNRASLSTFVYFLRPYFGQQHERDAAANLAAFEQVFTDLVAQADEKTRADLLIYRSFLAGMLGLVMAGSPYESADEKLRTDNGIAAIKTWTRVVSQRQPLVIQLEDAQWLDASSISAVQQLTYNTDDIPLALVLTSRYNDDGTKLVIPNIYSVPVHSFDLSRLSDEGVQEVAVAVLKGAVSERLASFISQRAEGNPFFTEQLALDLKERSALVQIEGRWDIRLDVAADVPSGINAVLIARLDRLTAQVKSVVQTAAVLGREFEAAILSRMLRDAELPAVQEAERESIWTTLDTLRYLFRHALLRDAAYNMQAQERLKPLHRLAAETIESLYPDDPSQANALLDHWHAAGDFNREYPYVDIVAKRLVQLNERFAEAEQLVTRALQQIDKGDVRRIKLLNRLSSVSQNRGEFDKAIDIARQALALSEETHDQEGLATSTFHVGMTHWRKGEYKEGRANLERSLTLRRALGLQDEIADCLRGLGSIAYSEGRHADARDYFQQGLAIYRETDNRRGTTQSLNSLGVVAQELGHYAEAREFMSQALALAREIGDRGSIITNLANLGVQMLDEGDYEQAETYFMQSLTLAREVGVRFSIGTALANLGNVALERERFQEAHDYFEQAIVLLRAIGAQQYATFALVLQGIVATLKQEYSKARTIFEQTLLAQQQTGDRFGASISLSYLSVIAFHEGDYLRAEPFQQQSLAIRREIQVYFQQASLGWLARIQLKLGQLDAARTSLQEALTIVKSMLARQQLEVLLAAVEWQLATGQYEAATELLGLILQHPKSDTETRYNARELLTIAHSHVNNSIIDAALGRGRTLSLEKVIEGLLVELI